MRYKQGQSREQTTLFPVALEDYVPEDHPVRVIDAFVQGLDLVELGFARSGPAKTGRPAYDPRDLLKLYIYGYMNRIRTSRRLEREAQRNVELMWLIGGLRPDFKTIADFRKDNGVALQQACKAFVLICRGLKLLGGEWVAIDGSYFKADNSSARNFNRDKLSERIAALEKKIAAYLQEMDERDSQEEAPELRREEVAKAVEALRARQGRYQELLKQLHVSDEKQVSLTDSDARRMTKGNKSTVGYNVQIAVDGEHKLIVAHEESNDGLDRNHLAEVALQAKEALGTETFSVAADRGYYDGEEIKTCVDNGLTPYISKFATSNSESRGLYGKQDFRYDPQADCYYCPAGEVLNRLYEVQRNGRHYHAYETSACGACAQRGQCTRRKAGNRRIERWVHESVLDEMEQRQKAHPEVKILRSSLAEHPFGILKWIMQQGHFLMRGLPNIRTEMSLSVLAYNLKRVINILGCSKLQAVLAK